MRHPALLLEGGNEFRGAMEEADRAALRAAAPGPVTIVPAAAVPEGGQLQAGANGVRWFKALGAADARSTGWIDGSSQADAAIADAVAASGVIFLTGGSPRYLAEALQGSRVWSAMRGAHAAGAVLAGSSAGAMVLCEAYYDPSAGRVMPGLGLLPKICILPHHDTFGRGWAPHIERQAKGVLPVGIDEETGMMNDSPGGLWTVYGKGAVTMHGPGGEAVYRSGERFELPRQNA
ncbi:MAG TPA: Type 1 glutamine amidotransferase-like domain-containing protein [Desulfobacterales bacterium]|nr:Type 1 glutamine amidotransferase-like domain-containing protein [Desulfobacterales bacterium]